MHIPSQRDCRIDLSCRLPVLWLFLSAAVWLVVGSLCALICSIKFHSPEFLAEPAWLTYGRVHPAGHSALLYGFCLPAGLGVALWLLARLGRAPLAQPWLVISGAMLWNLGVTVGIGGILAGDATGFASLDLPDYATGLLFLGYLLIALGGALTFHQRRERRLFVSQWFLVGALFWFPWIYSTAQLLVVYFPVRGVTQAIIAWWYAENLEVVWLWLVGLAAVFYFVPKLSGHDLHSRYLGLLTFWMLVLFGGWGGVPNSAPAPAWLPALSVVGTLLTAIPLLAVGLSVWRTAFRKPALEQRGQASDAESGGNFPGVAQPQPTRGSAELCKTVVGSAEGAASALGHAMKTQRREERREKKFSAAGERVWPWQQSVPLRFILFGVLAFLLAGFMRISGALPVLSQVTGLTWFIAAREQLNVGGFVMVGFGAIYTIAPQLIGREVPWPQLVRAHYRVASLGIAFVVLPQAVAGIVEGLKLQDANLPFMAVVKVTLPFLRVSTVGELLIALGHGLFLANLAALAFGFYRARVASACASLTADLFKPAEVKP